MGVTRRGRPAKPAALRIVAGTHKASRHGDATEIKRRAKADQQCRLPSPPAFLSGPARAEWRRIAGQLRDLGRLAPRNRAAFAGYCRAYGELVEAQAVIADEGRFVPNRFGELVVHPAVRVAFKAADQARMFAVELGLTPSAESRFAGQGTPVADPLDDFNSRRRGTSDAEAS